MANKISVYRGISYPVIYRHKDSAGNAVDMTGKTLYFSVKKLVYDNDAADDSAVIKKTITNHTGVVGTTTLNATGGVTGFQLSDVDTYIDPAKYHFDFIVEAANGQAEPPSVFGDFIVSGHPTNRNTSNG